MSHPSLQLLPELPSLSKLYLNAAATAARSRLLGSAGTVRLPREGHQVGSIVADVANLTEYQHLMGKAARDILPSGYLHALAFPVAMSVLVRDDFPLPLLGMIHLANRVEHLGPLLFNQPLMITAFAENLRGHRAGTQVDLISEVRADGSDSVSWRGVSSYLAKGVFLPGLDKPQPAAEREPFDAPDPTGLWTLGVDTGREYAAVSGDFNPIHLSLLSARVLGMRRSLAHGMYLAARVLADVCSPEPDAFRWDIAFEAPVYLPARVAVRYDDSTTDGAWQQSEFCGWNPRTGRRHFHGSVSSLGFDEPAPA